MNLSLIVIYASSSPPGTDDLDMYVMRQDVVCVTVGDAPACEMGPQCVFDQIRRTINSASTPLALYPGDLFCAGVHTDDAMSYLASATDLTSTLSGLLVDVHKAEPLDPHVTFKTLDSFLVEAKQVVCHIRRLLRTLSNGNIE